MFSKKDWLAIIAIIGGTIGAGLFGVPYVFAHSGVMQGTLWTLIIGSLAIILNLLQAEVSLSLPDRLRLPGMMKLLLPKRWWTVAMILTCMQYLITMFAYVSLSSIFINTILGDHPIAPAILGTIYALGVGGLIYKWIEGIKKYQKIIVTIFLAMLVSLIIYGFGHADLPNYLLGDKAYRFLPYGVLIYALNNASSIPVSEEILGREKKDLPFLIVIAGIFCMTIVLLRWRAIVGVSWAATSQDALSGLVGFLPGRMVKAGGIIGLLAILSPHFVFGENLMETLKKDFHVPWLMAWSMVALGPLLLYLYIQSDFVSIIGLSGAIFTGITCLLVGVMNLILHKKSRGTKETQILPYNKLFSYLVIVVFAIGILYEISKYIHL